jgi:hypothetical protein
MKQLKKCKIKLVPGEEEEEEELPFLCRINVNKVYVLPLPCAFV